MLGNVIRKYGVLLLKVHVSPEEGPLELEKERNMRAGHADAKRREATRELLKAG